MEAVVEKQETTDLYGKFLTSVLGDEISSSLSKQLSVLYKSFFRSQFFIDLFRNLNNSNLAK